MRGLFVVAGLAACGGGLPVATTIEPVAVVDPEPARADYYVTPAELGDPDVLARVRHRVRLRRYGLASLRLDGPPIRKRAERDQELALVLPVLGESNERVRIVIEDDDARYAVWIDRADTWLAVGAPARLTDLAGHMFEHSGVWVSLGAPVTVVEREPGRRRIQVRDPLLAIEGWLGERLLANVWLVPAGDRTPTQVKQGSYTDSWTAPPDKRPQARLVKGVKIRARPDLAAPIVAIVREEVTGAIVTPGPWTELEIVRPHARIVGFVERSSIAPTDDHFGTIGIGGGHGFGMSHADRIDVPAGTCLFDGKEGEVIGVQLVATTRLGDRGDDAWSLVYVDSPWSATELFVHDTGSDPKQPHFASCVR